MRELTIKEFAAIERVTSRTVYHWIAKGAVEYRRTPGGGVRIIDRRDQCRVGAVFISQPQDTGSGSL